MEEKEEIDDMTFDIKLADRVIRIHVIYDYIKYYSTSFYFQNILHKHISAEKRLRQMMNKQANEDIFVSVPT